MARRVESDQSCVGGYAGVDACVDVDAGAFRSSCMVQARADSVGHGLVIGYSLHVANIQDVDMDLVQTDTCRPVNPNARTASMMEGELLGKT